MHGALGRQAHVPRQLADQQFPDFARAPIGLVALEVDNQPLHGVRQLVGIAHRPAGAVAQRIDPFFSVAIEYLVAGLAGNAELPAHTLKKINALIEDIKRNPFRGLGKPEALKSTLSGWWSRRITQEHRLVYRVSGKRSEHVVEVAQCRYHYLGP